MYVHICHLHTERMRTYIHGPGNTMHITTYNYPANKKKAPVDARGSRKGESLMIAFIPLNSLRMKLIASSQGVVS